MIFVKCTNRAHLNTKCLFRMLFKPIILLTLLAAFQTLAEEKEPIITIVAGDNNAPFSFTLPDGTPTGLYIEFWKLWSKSNNKPIQIKMLSFEEAIKATKSNYTIHSGLFINEKRKSWASFSSPIHSVKTGIIYNNEFSQNLKLKDIKELKVSVQEESFQEDFLIKNYPDFEILNYFDGKDATDKLLNNEVEAVVGEIPYLKSQLAKRDLTGVFNLANEVLMENTVHGVIAKGQPKLLKLINLGIENISLKEIIKLERQWLPSLTPFFKNVASFDLLTAQEISWLKKQPSFSLAIDNNNYPYEFRNDKGVFSGISADYISFVNQQLDIKIKPVSSSNWLDAFEKFKSNEIDILSSIVITKERATHINFTNAYISTPTVIATRSDSFYVESMNDLNNKKLGVVSGFVTLELVKTDYPNIEIYLVDSISEGFDKLENGEIDAYIGSISIINFEINKRQSNDLMIAAFAPFKFEFAMAVRKGLEPLVPILNKIFSSMNEKQKLTIKNNWLATHVENGTSLETILFWGGPTLTFLLLIIVVIIRLNKNLKKEICARKKIESELKHLAQHDVLTALPNWRLFEELSSLALSHAKRNSNEQSLLFIDIDGFKLVNDSFGHKTGDELLVLIAERLKECVRFSDIVARIGGDEFCVHLCNQCNKIDTKAIASKIVESISAPFKVNNNVINIGASVGISSYPNDGSDIENLIQKADSAMYEAKKSGKNTYRFFQSVDQLEK